MVDTLHKAQYDAQMKKDRISDAESQPYFNYLEFLIKYAYHIPSVIYQ